MAREVQILLLCDPCLRHDERVEGEEVVVTIQGVAGGKARALTMCTVHRKEFFDPFRDLLLGLGQTPDKASTPKRAPTTPAVQDGDKVACPKCSRLYKNRGTLRSHCSDQHNRTLAQLEGKPTPFPCEDCEMAFERNQQLALHTKRAHGDAPAA